MSDEKNTFITKGGSEIVEYEFLDTQCAALPGPIVKRITDHIETHVGPIGHVQHERFSRAVEVSLYWVVPSEKRPFFTLVTSGLSAKSMNCPEQAKDLAFAELMLCLPADWPVNSADFKRPENSWPVKCLRRFAALPHETGAWLKPGDTIPNGKDAAPYTPDTEYCCFLIRKPKLFARDFHVLDIGQGRKINFYAIVPIFFEEMQFKLEFGAQALEDKFEEINLSEILKRTRINVCAE